MKSAKISQVRDHLSEYLRFVRKGESVIVYDRATPVARLEPIPATEPEAQSAFSGGLPAGILIPPRIVDRALRTLTPPPKAKRPAELVEALIAERRAGR